MKTKIRINEIKSIFKRINWPKKEIVKNHLIISISGTILLMLSTIIIDFIVNKIIYFII